MPMLYVARNRPKNPRATSSQNVIVLLYNYQKRQFKHKDFFFNFTSIVTIFPQLQKNDKENDIALYFSQPVQEMYMIVIKFIKVFLFLLHVY